MKLFLSTVTDEFEPKDKSLGVAYRTRLRQLCERPNVSVKIQEDFIATGNTTLVKLDDYIQSCDAVIHLVGDMTGARANPAAVRELAQHCSERGIDLGQQLPPLGHFTIALMG